MTSVVSTKAAAVSAGLLFLAAIATTVSLNSSAASGAVVPHAVATTSATSLFVKFDTIKGGLTAKAHAGQSKALSASLQTTTPPDGTTTFADFVITKPVDVASPVIVSDEANDHMLNKVEVFVVQPNASGAEVVVTKYTLQQSFITGDSISTTSAGEVERISLSYGHIAVTRLVGPGSPVTYG